MQRSVVVKGSQGQEYLVYPDRPFCSCPDFLFRCLKEGCVCKHIERARADRHLP